MSKWRCAVVFKEMPCGRPSARSNRVVLAIPYKDLLQIYDGVQSSRARYPSAAPRETAAHRLCDSQQFWAVLGGSQRFSAVVPQSCCRHPHVNARVADKGLRAQLRLQFAGHRATRSICCRCVPAYRTFITLWNSRTGTPNCLLSSHKKETKFISQKSGAI